MTGTRATTGATGGASEIAAGDEAVGFGERFRCRREGAVGNGGGVGAASPAAANSRPTT